ncbi:hypothetical protein V0M98_37375 (plasmid) [Pseudomonas silesiensis]|uniref:hypothetical protein n=1 Tax=Pseudomonas silesiensis TaxID=1853130 RepID=UPI0030D342F5
MSNPYTDNFILQADMAIILMISVVFIIEYGLYMKFSSKGRPRLEVWLTGLIACSFLGASVIPFVAFYDIGLVCPLMTFFCLCAGILLGQLSILHFTNTFPVLENRIFGIKWMTLSYAVLLMFMAWINTLTTSVC